MSIVNMPAKNRTPDLDRLWTLGGGDYKKLEEAYKQNGLRYEKPPRQLKEEKWFTQVTNPNSQEFLQPVQLKAAGLVSDTYLNDKRYPIKTVYQIRRLKTADGREWLLSKQYWIGLDRLGNELPISFDDKEMFFKPVLQYSQVKLDWRDPLSKIQTQTSVVNLTEEYTLPFSAEELDKIYSIKGPGDRVSLSIKERHSSEPPREIPKYNDFRDREFDELMEWATTPRFSMDRNVKDQLQDRQYG